ncbi:MAG: hypothetical protein RLZZ219_865 [Cyanobacteriota bacterium]
MQPTGWIARRGDGPSSDRLVQTIGSATVGAGWGLS